MMNKLSLILFCFFFLGIHTLYSQQDNKIKQCGTDHIQELELQNPKLALEKENYEQAYREAMIALRKNPNQARRNAIYTIPTVVHIVHQGEALGTGANLTDEQIATVINQANERFSHTQPNAPTFPNNPNYGPDTGIELCLATTDPNGNYTTGVIRHYDPSRAVAPYTDVSSYFQNNYNWNTNLYYNMYIMTNMTNASGVYIGSLDGTIYNGGGGFWSGLICHETGHYLSLAHTFNGCTNNDCLSNGDGVCDTPPKGVAGFNGGTCAAPNDHCSTDEDDTSANNPYRSVANGGLGNQPDMLENYLDYTGGCWSAFTIGQKDRMQFNITNNRSSQIANTAACASQTAPANDAGVFAIVTNNNACLPNFTPSITIKNYGTATLTSCDIVIEIDGSVIHTENWAGSLAADATEEITLSAALSISPGIYTLKASTNLPNGGIDGYANNDDSYAEVAYTEGGTAATLSFVFDQYPAETTWEIKDASDVVVASGGPYGSQASFSSLSIGICLADGCYDFIISDGYNDGICCGFGNGSYSLTEDASGAVWASGGEFASSETTNFCIEGNLSTDDILSASNMPPCSPVTNEIYVDHTASGSNDGSSWTNAYTDLQLAITNALPSDCSNIYVAEGSYKPTTTTSRGTFFTLEKNLNIYGGFPNGGGNADAELHPTILSGDIDNDGTLAGNSFHVVQVKNAVTASLYNLTIQGGNADNANSFARARGGGIFVNGANLNLANCKIINNKAIFGGAVFSTLSNQTYFLDCLIDSNEAGNGSAIYHSNETNLYLVRSRVTNNNSTIRCAIEINNSLYTYIENSVIANNPSTNANALGLIATNRNQTCDIYNSTILGESKNKNLITLQIGFGDILTFNINNSIVAHQNINFDKNVVAFNNNVLNFNHNNCYFQGASVMGTGTNALFSATAGGLLLNADYSVAACSPVVDNGDNTHTTNLLTDTDIASESRAYNTTVDIGAYESQAICPPARFVGTSENITEVSYSIYPNPTRDIVHISSESKQISIALYDILGKEMMPRRNQNTLDLSQMPKGTYLVHIHDEGKFLGVEKLVKY